MKEQLLILADALENEAFENDEAALDLDLVADILRDLAMGVPASRILEALDIEVDNED